MRLVAEAGAVGSGRICIIDLVDVFRQTRRVEHSQIETRVGECPPFIEVRAENVKEPGVGWLVKVAARIAHERSLIEGVWQMGGER